MSMTEAFRNYMLAQSKDVITHIGLFDATDTEITGGSPAYARKAVTWATPSGGYTYMSADLTFDVPAGAVVHYWRGFTALTGGTNYGGEAVSNEETFGGQGNYKLLAAETYLRVTDPS